MKQLQQHLPLAVLKRNTILNISNSIIALQQYLPLAVCAAECEAAEEEVTMRSTHCLPERREGKTKVIKQQPLPFTVCAAECEAAEEQNDDEVRTLLT